MWLLVKSGFHIRKNVSENYPQFGHLFSKNVTQPCHRPEKLKNISFEVAPNYQLARGAHMPWASPEQYKGIKLVSHDAKEMEVENCVVMATYLTF